MAVKVRERDGVWWLFVDHGGRRKAKKIGTGRRAKKLAEDAAVKITARLIDGDLGVFGDSTPPAEAPPTFDEVYAEWCIKYPATHAVAESTLSNYRSFAEHHLRPYFGAMLITSITVDTIEDFIAAKRASGGSIRRVGKPLADSSLRTGLLALRLILKRAARRKLIPVSPMGDVEWRGTARTENVDPFTGRELRAILAAADRLEPTFAALLRLWAQTGMRAGEVTGLQWQDVDVATGMVKVRRTFSHGKIGPTKTRQERDVAITHPIADDAAEWRPGATDASRAVLHGLRRLTCGRWSLRPSCSTVAACRSPRWRCTGRGSASSWPRRSATECSSSCGTRSPRRCCPGMLPCSRAAAGRLEVGVGVAQDVRALDAATIRNPGATSGRNRAYQRLSKRWVTTGEDRSPGSRRRGRR